MKSLVTIVAFLVLCSINSFATTYYVATNGNNSNNGTSTATPLLTIAAAVAKATTAGDTIYVRSGTYPSTTTISITRAGTSAANYTLSAYKPDITAAYPADGRPILDFSGMSVTSGNIGLKLNGANYWKIYGLRIKGAGDNGMLLQSTTHHTTIEFCDFYRNRDAGFQIKDKSHHCLILNCDAYENADRGTGTTTNGGNADGFAPKLDLGDSVIFRGCRAWLNSDDGWDGYLKATESGVPDGMVTILENCWTWRNGYYWLDGSTTADQNGNGFKMGGSDLKDQAHNFVVVKCLSFYNKGKGFDQNNNAGSMSLYNCTASKNGDFNFGLNSSGVTYAAGATFTVKNCTSLLPTSASKDTTFRSGTIKSYNRFSSTNSSSNFSSIDTTGVSAQRKIDGTLPDINFMKLQTSPKSALIDAGTVLSDVSYYGTVGVPYIGAGPDVGYAESNYNILPVTLLSFDAAAKNNNIILNWSTATETQNSGFQIERLDNTNSWQKIGLVQGYGNSNSIKKYSFTDYTTTVGNAYQYRLKQIDANGQFTYSNIISVKLNSSLALQLDNYPNPVQSTTTLRFTIAQKSKVNLSVYNTSGQLINTIVNENLDAGIYNRSFNASTLPQGNYFAKLTTESGAATYSFIKLN
jgi:hypothetical protein